MGKMIVLTFSDSEETVFTSAGSGSMIRCCCKSFNGSQDHYRCSNYKSNTGSCTAHFIREEVLKQIVWSRILDVTALFYDDIKYL